MKNKFQPPLWKNLGKLPIKTFCRRNGKKLRPPQPQPQVLKGRSSTAFGPTLQLNTNSYSKTSQKVRKNVQLVRGSFVKNPYFSCFDYFGYHSKGSVSLAHWQKDILLILRSYDRKNNRCLRLTNLTVTTIQYLEGSL